jgi:glutathione peroxidase
VITPSQQFDPAFERTRNHVLEEVVPSPILPTRTIWKEGEAMSGKRSRSRVLATLAPAICALTLTVAPPVAAARDAGAFAFSFTSIDGEPLPLTAFEGKALLVVNTASFCGFTPQYDALQELWERYRERGLVVLGVPSNDFGGQEPGTESEIKQFCEVNFSIDFPLTTKEHVNGDAAHPFYKWAGRELGEAALPRWNFHKYLVSPDGRLVAWFATATSPTSEKVLEAVEANLPASDR